MTPVLSVLNRKSQRMEGIGTFGCPWPSGCGDLFDGTFAAHGRQGVEAFLVGPVPDLLGETGWDSGKSRVSPAVPMVDSAGHWLSVYTHLHLSVTCAVVHRGIESSGSESSPTPSAKVRGNQAEPVPSSQPQAQGHPETCRIRVSHTSATKISIGRIRV